MSEPTAANTLAEAFRNVVVMSKKCVDDERNTDNAWVEVTSLNLHCDEDEFPSTSLKTPQGTLEWATMTSELGREGKGRLWHGEGRVLAVGLACKNACCMLTNCMLAQPWSRACSSSCRLLA